MAKRKILSSATFTPIDKRIIARAAKAAYEQFVVELGLEHDARIMEWRKLKEVHRIRWAAVARAVSKVFRGDDQLGGDGGVQRSTERAGGLQPSNAKAPAQVPTDSNRGARLRRKASK